MKNRFVFAATLVLMLLLALTSAAAAGGQPVRGAVFTTVNPDVDGADHCLNGGPGADAGLVDCNIYDGKEFVWLSGGPDGNQPGLADGTYFFAVLVPGGQGGSENPNDGTENNLSDLDPTSATGAGDAWQNRVFSIVDGQTIYAGSHDFDSSYAQSQYGKIRLFPYDDTTNPGGEYILAVCSLADADPTTGEPGVDPSDCKYDAFKVKKPETPVSLPLIVSKTAVPSFDLTYTWSIDKSVDQTLVKQVGGEALFTYFVTVAHDTGTPSNWQVNGVITVENPNTFAVSGVDVTDAVDNNGVCSVAGGLGVTIPGETVIQFDYTCIYDADPFPPYGINTATATWFEGDYKHEYGTATFDFTTARPNLIDECVAVSDTFAGDLGIVCADNSDPVTFTYTRSITVPTWDCQDFDNTATFTALDTGAAGSDSQSVRVCGPMKTGALTMGFWQNKNGQDLIKNYCGGTSGTSLFSFLTGLNPFKDLTRTACKDIAAYAYSLIKAANASGSSMNAMLKAQMLATALDVYYSDPALGGNRIGARVPIGSVLVDLTMICTDMTCKAFEDSSAVFGGTPKTVLEMLTYAASQSNIGGSLWYANNKAVQELAKDAFDAINNQKVFAP